MSNKASDIVKTLSPLYGEAGAREVALAAVEKGHAENDLGAPPAIDNEVVVQVIKSLTEGKVQLPQAAAPGTTQVNIQHSAAAAASADNDLEVTVAAMQGTLEGMANKLDAVIVHLNKSFASIGQVLGMVSGGVNAVGGHVVETNSQVVELKKSLEARRAPRTITGAQPEPNLNDRALNETLAAGASEVQERLKLHEVIQVEIAKSVELERVNPGSQKARLKQLGDAGLALTRPIPTRDIASTYNIQLPA